MRVVAVDFSAADRPVLGANSIWVASSDGVVANLSTRAALERCLASLVATAVGSGERVLVAVDVSLGYPAGFAAALGLRTWRGVWELLAALVVDGPSNRSNRFAVAAELNDRLGAAVFWGRPASVPVEGVPVRRPAPVLPEWRLVEEVLRAGGRRPHAAWKLAYAGAVGSQMLLGIPLLERLRVASPGAVAVWPFEPWAEAPVVLAEVWPSMLPFAAEQGSCADERQVRAVLRWLSSVDVAGLLDAAPDTPVVRQEEGWVLGVTVP